MSDAKPIALEQLDAEAEADRLLEEDDLAQAAAAGQGQGPRKANGADGREFDAELDELEGNEGLSLPRPAVAIAPVRPKMHPAPLIVIWISLSSSVILMNAWILGDDPGDLGFSYPIFLTTAHLVFATIATRLMANFTSLIEPEEINSSMSWQQWRMTIVPIGALFSASLCFNNVAYISLSVPFIQMLKAFTSVAVLSMSVLAGMDNFNQRTLTTVLAISFGVMIASYGEIDFVLGGFIAQALGIAFEASRLVAIQKLLQGGLGVKLDPLQSLYLYAPVCATFNLVLIPWFEGWAPLVEVLDKVGGFTLLLNCSVALCLNVSVVFLIGCAGSLVLTLSGVVKDILLVAFGVLLLGDSVSGTQLVGYGIALCGLVAFKTPEQDWVVYVAKAKSLVGR